MAQPVDDYSYQVELFISCQHLKCKDLLSKSDPMVVIYKCSGPKSSGVEEIGRTEMITNAENPKFLKTIKMRYYFEKAQYLQFVVYDVDNSSASLQDQDLLGKMTCQLAEICGSKGQQVTKPIEGPNNEKNGFITIQVEDVSQCEDDVVLTFKGTKMAKMDLLSKSDPYFILSRITESGSWLDVYKSEVIKDTSDPNWNPFVISVSKLCKNDYNLPLRFKCFDWNLITAHKEMGEFRTNLKQLMDANSYLTLIQDTKNKKKEMGIITCNTKLMKRYSFLQYLAGGLEISLILGIDFTGSNGNPQNPSSLHYVGGSQMNQYEKAIRSVGDIVSYYDRDKMFPVFGFGAKIPPKFDQAVHCFPMNANNAQPECFGVTGILDVYRQAINAVQLNGPTYFAPIINNAIDRYASEQVSQANQRYFILLMITDGEICDMSETIGAIVRASRLPMSIIIVGVGNADFTNMNILDCDDGLLKHKNEVAMREIVQFVPFSKFASNYTLLAEETLAEVPSQVTKYFSMKNIIPKEPMRVDPFQLIAQMAPQLPDVGPIGAAPQPLGVNAPPPYPVPQQPPQPLGVNAPPQQ